MKKAALIGSALAFSPLFALAQSSGPSTTFFSSLISQIGSLISAAVPVVVALAVLLFLWGLATYMLNQDDAEKRAGARSLMIWGIVIIFVMVALWGLVGFLSQITGVGTGGTAVTPPVP